MSIIEQLEAFLASGGEPDRSATHSLDDQGRVLWHGLPAEGTFTAAEMRAAYGDDFMDDFWRQFEEIHRDDEV